MTTLIENRQRGRMTNYPMAIEAETILAYLLRTHSAIERTKRAIRDACQLSDKNRANQALLQLVQLNYIVELEDSTYELSAQGQQFARSVHPDYQPRIVNNIQQTIEHVTGGRIVGMQQSSASATPLITQQDMFGAIVMDEDTQRVTSPVYEHPFRVPSVDNATGLLSRDSSPCPINFMLAFESTPDMMPVPVFHNDILGRSPKADIYIRGDTHMSRRHCRFVMETDRVDGHQKLFVEDLSTSNGTSVDGIILDEGLHLLLNGSRLKIGSTSLIVVQILY
jgi:hypothetical protein